MVILTFEDVNHGFMASTATGILQVIQFQGKFYAVRKVYHQLQEAIDKCRQDLEEGFCSIVLRHGRQVEVWAALSKEVTITPSLADRLSQGVASGQKDSPMKFRGRPYPAGEWGQTITAAHLEGQFYRGQRISITALEQMETLPNDIFHQNVLVRG